MDGLFHGKSYYLLKWMIWGYSHFRKPPYHPCVSMHIHGCSHSCHTLRLSEQIPVFPAKVAKSLAWLPQSAKQSSPPRDGSRSCHRLQSMTWYHLELMNWRRNPRLPEVKCDDMGAFSFGLACWHESVD